MTTDTARHDKDQRLLLTVGEACELTHLSRPMIYDLINAGKLKSLKAGRARRIPLAALEQFIAESCAVDSGPGAA